MSSMWYSKSPVGINTIGKFMPTISKQAKLSKIYTNHCIRATCVTTLRDSGCPSRDIKSVTGHKSDASIELYSKTPDNVRRDMSRTLAGLPSTVKDITVSNAINVVNTPEKTTMFSNVTFNNCVVNVTYK